MIEGSFTIQGLTNYNSIIEEIIKKLQLSNHWFDIKLILTEAITNAFNHGNKGDKEKPILIRFAYDGKKVIFEIVDCGDSEEDLIIPNEINDSSLLEERGRGLFLVQCLTDKVKLYKSTLRIEKAIMNLV
jgi:serine/threonine-protein kinase RsbW